MPTSGASFHVRGPLGAGGTDRYRAPATLLEEAWAVGAGGIVVQARAGELRAWALPSGEWLRAVLALAPDDVWIGGDGGTLLHHDGAGFHPVPHPLGANAAVTAIVATKGAVRAAGPAGILELKKP